MEGRGLCVLLSSFTFSHVILNLYDLLSRVKHRYIKKEVSMFLFIHLKSMGPILFNGTKHSTKYLLLGSAEQRFVYRFKMKLGRVNDDSNFIFGRTIPLTKSSSTKTGRQNWSKTIDLQREWTQIKQQSDRILAYLLNSKVTVSDLKIKWLFHFLR